MSDYLGQILVKLGADGADLASGLADGRKAFDQLRGAEKQLTADLKRGVIGNGEYQRLTAELARNTRELQAAMQSAYARTGSSLDALGKSFEGGGHRAQAFGRGVLEASRGLEDLTTGGALGVLNNIQTTFYSMAQAAGLSATNVALASAGVGAMATGVYVLYTNWDKLSGVFREEHTVTEADHMASLEKNTARTAQETRNLTAAKQRQGEVEEMLRRKSEEQQDTATAIGKAIAESGDVQRTGGQVVAQGLQQVLTEEGAGSSLSPVEDKKLKAATARLASLREQMAAGMPGTLDADVALQAAIQEETRLQADILRHKATIGDALRVEAERQMQAATRDPTALADQAEKRPDLFPGKLVEGLRDASPAGRKAKEREEDNNRLAAERTDRETEAMKKARVEREQAADAEVSALVSRKAKPLEADLAPSILGRIRSGGKREDVLAELAPEVERRLGDLPHAKEAAGKIARQLTEKVYADVMAAREPGVGDAQAAGALLDQRAGDAAKDQAKAAKRAREAAENGDDVGKFEGRAINDPVTGKFLSKGEMFNLRQADKEGKDRVQQWQKSNTPQGRQALFRNRQLVGMQRIEDQVSRANPNMAPQDVQQVARQTQRNMQFQRTTMGQVNVILAMQAAMNQLAAQIMQGQAQSNARVQSVRSGHARNQAMWRQMQERRRGLMENQMPQGMGR